MSYYPKFISEVSAEIYKVLTLTSLRSLVFPNKTLSISVV